MQPKDQQNQPVAAPKPKLTEAEKMAQLAAWLDQLCEHYQLDRAEFGQLVGPILDMARDVSHGPSRPGVPITGFALGYVAGQSGAGLVDGAKQALAQLETLLAPYRNEDGIVT